MRFETEADLAKHIKNDGLLPVYLFCGSQSFLVRLYAKRLREKAVPPSLTDFNFTYFEASRTDIDEVSDALESVSFLGGTRLVQLTDLDADKLSSTDWDKLQERLQEFPEETVLLISQQNIAVDTKKSARWRTIVKQVEKLGAVAVLDARSRRRRCVFSRPCARKTAARSTRGCAKR